ncbi:MAG: hypothetical protein IPP45_16190 [Sphingomonadales bacterium]|nr:hypothetical protein [Sphingomonadales bacterium]
MPRNTFVAIEAMIRKSTTDAKGFGDALEGSAAKFPTNAADRRCNRWSRHQGNDRKDPGR